MTEGTLDDRIAARIARIAATRDQVVGTLIADLKASILGASAGGQVPNPLECRAVAVLERLIAPDRVTLIKPAAMGKTTDLTALALDGQGAAGDADHLAWVKSWETALLIADAKEKSAALLLLRIELEERRLVAAAAFDQYLSDNSDLPPLLYLLKGFATPTIRRRVRDLQREKDAKSHE